MSASNTDKIRTYFRRQYEIEEGSAEDNINAIFAEDADLRLGDGNAASLDDVIASVTRLRSIPKSQRTIKAWDFEENGDSVAFRSLVRFPDPETGEMTEMASDAVWRFNGRGKVVEARSTSSITSALPPNDG
jgi:hypothetical protein